MSDTDEELRAWLKGVGSLACKALAGNRSDLHAAPKPKVIDFIISDPESRDRALESQEIQRRSLEMLDARRRR